MLPSLTCFDGRDRPLVDSEGCANFFLRFPVGAANSDLSDDLAGELGVRVTVPEFPSSRPVAVVDVLLAGKPAEVIQPVVRPIKVDVVGILSRFRWADESSKDYSVDHLPVDALPVSPERDVVISGPGDARSANSSALQLQGAVVTSDHSVERADASEIGYLVSAFKPRHGFPDFCGRILLSHRRLLEGAWLGLRQAFARPAVRFVSGEFYHA